MAKKRQVSGWRFHLGADSEGSYSEVRIPHDWAVDAPFNRGMEQGAAQGFRDRWGIGWYRCEIFLEERRAGYGYCLEFGGVYENSTVWVNGQEAGGWHYGYSSFRLDVTGLVREGENTILVRVDNTAVPADRWYSGCGIYRPVYFLEMPRLHLDRREITVRTEWDGECPTVEVDTGLCSPVRGRLAFCGENRGKGGDCEGLLAEGDEGKLSFTVRSPRLWSAEEPNLYRLWICLPGAEKGEPEDSVTMRIGLRRISISARDGMTVNGRTVKLKGVCLHQEAGSCGTAVRPEIWRERLLQLKELGCNAIRAAHHPFAEEFLDLCDELGFYVYEECFDKWTSGMYGRYFETDWQKDLAAMVKRDRNRACIFIWGTGNEVENQGQASMLAILGNMRDAIRRLDASRPVTYAMNPHFKREREVDLSRIKDIQKFVDEEDDWEIYDPQERVERIRRIAEIVDVISCNYQEQWYELIHDRIPDKAVLGTETYQMFMGDYSQMQNFTNANPNLVPFEKDYCIGGMIWTGYDYLGESAGYPAKGWSGALLRTNNERRPGYYILQGYWSGKPMVHFSVMDYSVADEVVKEHWDSPPYADHWHFPQFRKALIPYIVASNCDEAELYLNGKRFVLPKPSDCPNRLITGFLPWQPGTVRVVGYRAGEAVCEHVTVTPGPAARLAFSRPDPERETCFMQAQEGYECLLTVRAVDAEGHPCFRESARVRFRIDGPGEILAVDNGDITGNEPYRESSIHLYRGAASVRIAFTGKPGRVTVYADGDGMLGGRYVISVSDEPKSEGFKSE